MDSKGYSRSALALLVAAAFLSLLFAGGAAAQTMPTGMTMVSGLYVNADAGVEIEFPDGWEGVAIDTDKALIVTTTMGGTSEKAILLMISDKTEVENPTDPNEFSEDTEMECGTPSVASRTVAGKSGQEVTVECTRDDGVTSKMKMVIANTEEEWIVVMYMAPTAEFAADEAKFDATVQSLQVEGAIDSEGMGGIPGGSIDVDLTATIQTVLIAGENVNLDVRSSSTVSAFELNEETKTISFTVDGETGTEGTTEISIGDVLEGPYTVTIDGQATTDFEETVSASGEAMLTISYTHSTRDVDVTGTNVVPEFPVALIGVIAAIVGIVAILGRTRLVPGYRQR